VGHLPVPCLHLTRHAQLDGVRQGTIEEWKAIEPPMFGERLIRLDNGLGVTEVSEIGHNGASVFPGSGERE
ncbi:hypothetical protein OAX78_04070, partial [Planctomycetota bacterium]|nr:hypothetical protein [Planctomycetota bacterium]